MVQQGRTDNMNPGGVLTHSQYSGNFAVAAAEHQSARHQTIQRLFEIGIGQDDPETHGLLSAKHMTGAN